MRKTKDTPEFPYSAGGICYIEVDGNGTVSQTGASLSDKKEAYENVKTGKTRLYAV